YRTSGHNYGKDQHDMQRRAESSPNYHPSVTSNLPAPSDAIKQPSSPNSAPVMSHLTPTFAESKRLPQLTAPTAQVHRNLSATTSQSVETTRCLEPNCIRN
ncbi:15398_t:CDS:1, partial [Acaulospora colombiana]